MNTIPTSGDCCNPCAQPQVVRVPGQGGQDGEDGDPGLDGLSAISQVINPVLADVMPAAGANVILEVTTSLWMLVGQPVYVGGSTPGSNWGIMQVVGAPDSTHVELKNPGYSENSTPGTPAPHLGQVVPGGWKGTASSGAGTFASGSINIPPASVDPVTNAFLVTIFPVLSGVPLVLVVTARKPATGSDLFATLVDGSLAINQFTVVLSSIPPGAGYFLDWIAILP